MTIKDLNPNMWKPTSKKSYKVMAYMARSEGTVYNHLEDVTYNVKHGDIVLRGVATEEWVSKLDKVCKTYTDVDGRELTKGFFDKGGMKEIKTKQDKNNKYFKYFLPENIQMDVKTSCGDVLKANRPGIQHAGGDYLICRAGMDNKPDISEILVVNGSIMKFTYT